MGATAAAAAAAWEAGPAGTSAAAAAAFVAASHNKQGEWKKGTDDMEETKEGSSSSSHSSSSNLAGAQIDLVNTSSSKGESLSRTPARCRLVCLLCIVISALTLALFASRPQESAKGPRPARAKGNETRRAKTSRSG